ncbi:hypothetical protein CPSG_01968 [Coccidioides posadasii str. Silveira]|uniref:Uncharacterized protein n=1 Tax=Coccidioides posadasii (strain RMSCC 757 / Silveira) TaxID=443226 RepID=E9CWY5_COCPS|nr:hypothetical protein CPSG_01968 [Coccidioides posadasii str. Silveira]
MYGVRSIYRSKDVSFVPLLIVLCESTPSSAVNLDLTLDERNLPLGHLHFHAEDDHAILSPPPRASAACKMFWSGCFVSSPPRMEGQKCVISDKTPAPRKGKKCCATCVDLYARTGVKADGLDRSCRIPTPVITCNRKKVSIQELQVSRLLFEVLEHFHW